jgi:hypothetical protein
MGDAITESVWPGIFWFNKIRSADTQVTKACDQRQQHALKIHLSAWCHALFGMTMVAVKLSSTVAALLCCSRAGYARAWHVL